MKFVERVRDAYAYALFGYWYKKWNTLKLGLQSHGSSTTSEFWMRKSIKVVTFLFLCTEIDR